MRKTNTLCNMLLQGWLNYDTVTLYTINPEQEMYTMMREFFDELSCELLTLADPETVTPVENLHNQDLKVVIFDDKKSIREIWIKSRNISASVETRTAYAYIYACRITMFRNTSEEIQDASCCSTTSTTGM